MIRIRGLWKKFMYTVALQDINLDIEHPTLALIKGPNGSGKTTLLKVIIGLLKPSKGGIEVFGYDPSKNRGKLISLISFYFEDDPLPWWMTGREYIEYVSFMKRYPLTNLKELINGLDIMSFWNRKIFTYSSGMKRKIQILKAFIGDSKILILDEPLTLLDRKSKKYLIGYLKEIKSLKTILVASHIDEGLSSIADTIIEIENGKIITIASTVA